MNTFYLAQGLLTNQPPVLKATSPAFLYGESAFTSFLAVDGKVKGLEFHKERIERAAVSFWGAEGRQLYQRSFDEVSLASGKLNGSFRVRLTLYKDEGLKFFWSFEAVNPKLEFRKVESIRWENFGPFYNFKSANYAIIFNELKKREADDLIKIGRRGEVFELSTSNLLLYKNGQFQSPAPSENVLEGCQLSFFKTLPGFEVVTQKITLEDLFKAEFVLGSNAVKEFFVISQVDEKPLTYSKEQVEDFWNQYQKSSALHMTDLC